MKTERWKVQEVLLDFHRSFLVLDCSVYKATAYWLREITFLCPYMVQYGLLHMHTPQNNGKIKMKIIVLGLGLI